MLVQFLRPFVEPVIVGGAARWLTIGGLPAFHPAEIAKLAVVVYLAHWMTTRGGEMGSFRRGLLPFLVLLGLVVGLVAVEPDLGTTGVLTLTMFTMFLVAGGSLLQVLLIIPLGVAAVIGLLVIEPYQMERITTFMDPWAVAEGAGYQTVQGVYALALGGVFGTGLGASSQPGGLDLPNRYNDFIFASVGEELGLLGAVLVVGLFLLLAWRGIRVAMRAPDTFGGLLALGITAWLCFQATINIGVVVNLLPLTGLPLPFLSDGGTSLVVSLLAVGILLSISRETSPRGVTSHADPHRSRWHRRPHLPRPGRGIAPGGPGHPDLELHWLGGRRGLESQLVPAAGLPFERLWLRSLRTVDASLDSLMDPLRLLASVPQAVAALLRRRPDVIYRPVATWPSRCSLAAALLRIPSAALGGQRRAWSQRSDGGAAGVGCAASYAVARGQCRPSPSSPGRRSGTLGDPRSARPRGAGSTCPWSCPLLLVFGGSQSVLRLDDAIAEAVGDLVTRGVVVHVTGAGSFAERRPRVTACRPSCAERYRP